MVQDISTNPSQALAAYFQQKQKAVRIGTKKACGGFLKKKRTPQYRTSLRHPEHRKTPFFARFEQKTASLFIKILFYACEI